MVFELGSIIRADCVSDRYVQGPIICDPASGTYRVNMAEMKQAMNALTERLLRFQGDGDYDGVVQFMERTAVIGPGLQSDLDGLAAAGIPVDIVFDQ